jgi:hypothetical protein
VPLIKNVIHRFHVKRPLTARERELRLDIRKPAGNAPHYQLSLIRLNSTFVECVDKWYAERGFGAMVGGGLCAVALWGSVAWLRMELRAQESLLFLLGPLLGLVVAAVCLYAFLCDAFTYTHYPIRFNRKNRQVYAFRPDGTVLKAPWDRVYWTILGHANPLGWLNVAGHVMDESGKTVLETFALSVNTKGKEGEDDLRNHFEFFRLYMQDGPAVALQRIQPVPLIMLPPIDRQRESWAFGWERLTLNDNGFPLVQLVGQVFTLPESLFRWIAMRTSKIPQWPQWVEDECRVEPDDPWRREPGYRDEEAIAAAKATAGAQSNG